MGDSCERCKSRQESEQNFIMALFLFLVYWMVASACDLGDPWDLVIGLGIFVTSFTLLAVYSARKGKGPGSPS